MKAILISTQPQWVEKILNGIKKDEIRKGTALYKAINKLIEQQGVAPMLIYCTKKYDECLWYKKDSQRYVLNYGKPTNDYLNGKVVARFNATAEEIKQYIGVFWAWGGHPYYTDNVSEENLLNRSCLSATELENYLQGKIGTAIHVNDLEIFDKPKELSEFKVWGIDYPTGIVDPLHDCTVYYKEKLKPLNRAPQSWCWIEV